MTATGAFFGTMVPLCGLIALFPASNARNIDNIEHILSLTKLFKFSSQKDCLDECATPLVIAIYDMTAYGNSRTHFADICSEYSSTMQCFANEGERCKDERHLVELLTGGIDIACDSQRSEFDKAFGCIDIFKDRPIARCDRSCHMYRSLRTWTSSGYLDNLKDGNESLLMSLRDAGPFCSGLSCYLKCAQDTLRSLCGPAGEITLDLVTRPLQKLSELYKKSPVEVQTLLKSTVIPPECATIVETETEQSLIFNEGILRDLEVGNFYDDMLESKNENNDGKDADYFDLSLVKIAERDQKQNGLFNGRKRDSQSTAYIVFTVVFVVMVLLVTVIGLVIAVTWCVVSNRRSSRKMNELLKIFAMQSPAPGVVERGVKSPSRSVLTTPKRATD